MPNRSISLKVLPGARIALAALLWMMAAGTGWPQMAAPPPASQPSPEQTSPPPPTPPPPTAPPGGTAAAPAPTDNPGLFNEMGKALEKSLSSLPTLKSPSETLDDLKGAAKNAGDSLSRLTVGSSVAEGRMKCPVAANGASDCKAAADKLCQAKGLKEGKKLSEGKSLSTDSVEACSPKVLIPGRTRKPDDCRTEHFVIRALCQ
jgi:hypothetical protein